MLSRNNLISAFAICFVALCGLSTHAQGLHLYDVSGSPSTGRDAVWEVDVDTPAANNPVTMDINNAIAGFEYGQELFYAASTNDNTELFVLKPESGDLIETIVMNFPAGGNVITSLEFVGDTLYGGFATEGGGATPGSLVTIDTTTGNDTLVGDFGFGGPTGGLAYKTERCTRSTPAQQVPPRCTTLTLSMAEPPRSATSSTRTEAL
ncbi:MAG: hypothetical protein AAF497_22140 [Planctomycetota bacterium]